MDVVDTVDTELDRRMGKGMVHRAGPFRPSAWRPLGF